MSMGYPFCDSDCPSVVTSPLPHVPTHLCLLSLMFLIMSVTPLCFRIQFVTLSILEGDSYHDSFHLPLVVTSFSSWVLLSDQVSQPYVITGSIHSLNAFLFSLIGTFLSRMMLSSLQNALHPCPILLFISCTWSWSLVTICPRYTYLSTSSIFFPSTITSSLLTCLLHITLVFPRCILRPTGLLMSWISWSISCSFDVELAMRTISSAKIRWDKYSTSILTPLFSQCKLKLNAGNLI